MTLSELKTRVWDRLEEDSSDPQRYPAADVLEYLNDGVQHINSRAGLDLATTGITQRAGRLFYDLPTDCIHVARVVRFSDDDSDGTRDSGEDILTKVDPVSYHDLDNEVGVSAWSRWERQEGTYATHYGIFGMDEIFLFPQIATGTEAYEVTYVRDVGASDLSADTDEPSLPDEYHEELVDYAVGRCLLVDGLVEEAAEELQAFAASMREARDHKATLGRVWAPSARRLH